MHALIPTLVAGDCGMLMRLVRVNMDVVLGLLEPEEEGRYGAQGAAALYCIASF
jgi:hypothetical protein